MLRADSAKIEWSSEKKQWHVVVTVGAEVIKRWCKDRPHEVGDDVLRTVTVETARDEGYEVEPERVTIAR